MKKLLILLFSLLISFNAYSVQKSDLEGKTYTYLQKTNTGDWKIEHEYLKNGSLNSFSVNEKGKIYPGDEADIWWVKNNSLYIQYQGSSSPTAFSFDFNNNKSFFESGGKLYEMTIVKIDGDNVEDANKEEVVEDSSITEPSGIELKLINAYVDYLILKNLNDRYGSYSDMDDIKKLMRSIQQFYENILDTNIDNLWDKAVNEYEREYGENITTFASFYSTQGEGLYKLVLMGFNQQANEVGASSSDVEKDF